MIESLWSWFDALLHFKFEMIAGVLALIYGFYMLGSVLSISTGGGKAESIAGAIHEGVHAFLKIQYKYLVVVNLVVVLPLWLLGVSFTDLWPFVLGSALSFFLGYLAMLTAVRANIRTVYAARAYGMKQAFDVAFKSGAFLGLLVMGVICLIVPMSYYYYNYSSDNPLIMNGFLFLCLGALCNNIFVGFNSGLFSKGADVAVDLVGKVEAGIPEDDPRNPAVIVDNVGGNIMNCLDTVVDIFSSYLICLVVGANILHIAASSVLFIHTLYSIVISSIAATIVVMLLVKARSDKPILKSFRMAVVLTALLTAVGCFCFEDFSLSSPILQCTVVGLFVVVLVLLNVEGYTSFSSRSIIRVAEASTTGHATNIIQGIAVALKRVVFPVSVVAVGGLISYYLYGEVGVFFTVIAALSLSGIMISFGVFAAVSDNAGGLAEMAAAPAAVRKITDSLDRAGGIAAEMVKMYRIVCAVLTALVVMIALPHVSGMGLEYTHASFILSGLLLGAAVVCFFAAKIMSAVGPVAMSLVAETRRQFKERPGIMQGTELPNFTQAVRVLTFAVMRRALTPALLAAFIPLVGFTLVKIVIASGVFQADIGYSFYLIPYLLQGVMVVGFVIALITTICRAVLDSTKKYIESEPGGKGSDQHKAAITGDTVGDGLYAVAPAIIVLMKLSMVMLLMYYTFQHYNIFG
jgi:K(+)-stimulated pyrophosphate-energized sodium pump